MSNTICQVAIIGAGPSGLSAAIRLKQSGAKRVVVIERDNQAGGIPRHCGHSPFGMREFNWVVSGKVYANRLKQMALDLGVEIWLNSTVNQCQTGGLLTITNLQGRLQLNAEKVIICTGNRETPRSARLVSGTRPSGIVTTGALQSMVYLKNRRPFKRPVIVGTELIAFSALLTCRHAKIKPQAMIESGPRTTYFKAASLLPGILGIPVYLNTKLVSIRGRQGVDGVEVCNEHGETRLIDCDGVIFSGQFVSESSLIRASHLQHDPRSGGPLVDQYFRCSDPAYFACGNVLHPVDTAGWCWTEGRKVADIVAADLIGALPKTDRCITIESPDNAIKYFTPQKISLTQNSASKTLFNDYQSALQIRFNCNHKGQLRLSDGQTLLAKKSTRAMYEQRQLFKLPDYGSIENSERLLLSFTT